MKKNIIQDNKHKDTELKNNLAAKSEFYSLERQELNNKKFFIILIILFLMGYFFYRNIFVLRQDDNLISKTYIETNQEDGLLKNNDIELPQIKAEDHVLEKEILEVRYNKKNIIIKDAQLSADSLSGEYHSALGNFFYSAYEVGTIASGKYKDGSLILVVLKPSGRGKGVASDGATFFRYVKKDDSVFLLSNISYSRYFAEDVFTVNFFEEFGLELKIDDKSTIPIFEWPTEIYGANERQKLEVARLMMNSAEEYGELDLSKLDKVFTHDVYGDIYTTKLGLASSYDPEDDIGFSRSIENCNGSECFYTNQFFAFRPDGTFIKLNYYPDILIKEANWFFDEKIDQKYVPYTVVGCSRTRLEDNTVVLPSSIDEKSLIPIQIDSNTGDILYGLKDKNHELYVEFYDNYKKNYHSLSDEEVVTYTEFFNSRPLFFWYDPFGRIIRFNNYDFLPPHLCEPIIYLYPQDSQKISVKLDSVVNITESMPKYIDRWEVEASPDGEIINLIDSEVYPYIFWEGWSFVFPVQEDGFVVAQNEVEQFLNKKLIRLGLNQKEKEDFMLSWLPYFSGFPYYFITFIDQETIDKIAPLEVLPKPDTIIRVLMDVKPLVEPIEVKDQQIDPVPTREGFTLVEWGGLKR